MEAAILSTSLTSTPAGGGISSGPMVIKVMLSPAHTPEQAESVKPLTEVLAEHLDSMVPDEARDWCEVHSSVEIGTPYQRIIAATEDSDIDLLVMNIHGKGMVERALMGSTAERVIRAVTCPVLAVPAKIQ